MGGNNTKYEFTGMSKDYFGLLHNPIIDKKIFKRFKVLEIAEINPDALTITLDNTEVYYLDGQNTFEEFLSSYNHYNSRIIPKY